MVAYICVLSCTCIVIQYPLPLFSPLTDIPPPPPLSLRYDGSLRRWTQWQSADISGRAASVHRGRRGRRWEWYCGGGGKTAGKKGKKKTKKPVSPVLLLVIVNPIMYVDGLQSVGVSSYHDNETPVHQNRFDSSKSSLLSSLKSPLSRNGKTAKQNGTNLSKKKTKKVPPQAVGKGSSNYHQVLAKSDSEDKATPILVSLQLLYFYSNWWIQLMTLYLLSL